MKGVAALAALFVLATAPGAGGTSAGGISLRVPRAVHTATLLPSGRVLVAGGCTLHGCETDARSASTEIYVPRGSGAGLRPGPRLLGPRVGHTATSLGSGGVLLAGGWSGEGSAPLASAELYVPATNRFVRVGRMIARRGGHSATRLRDGRVLVAGGENGEQDLASAELYDPRTRRFTATGALGDARAAHAAVLLRDGRVLVVGGSNGNGVLASAEVYDPATGRFARVGSLDRPRHKHALAALQDGDALVVGGSDANDFRGRYASAELFDAKTGRFVQVIPMHEARFKITDAAVTLPSGSVLVGGGGARAEVYDPVRRRFTSRPGLGGPYSFSTVTRLRNGTVLLAGGYDDRIAVTRQARVIFAR